MTLLHSNSRSKKITIPKAIQPRSSQIHHRKPSCQLEQQGEQQNIGLATEAEFSKYYHDTLPDNAFYVINQYFQFFLRTITEFIQAGCKNHYCCRQGVRVTCLRLIPVLSWIPKYDFRNNLLHDTIVGITMSFVIVPKAMAHAMIANIPPVVGIYSAFCGCLVYGIFGTKYNLSLGTAALISMVYGDAISSSDRTPEENIAIIPTFSMIVGIVTLLLSILGADALVVFIPPCVFGGFTTAAAFLIAGSQLKHIVGLPLKAHTGFHSTIIEIVENIEQICLLTTLVSFLSFLLLIISKFVVKKISPHSPDPGPIILVILSTVISKVLALNGRGLAIVGACPTGLTITYPKSIDMIYDVILNAITVAVLNYILTTTIGKSLKNGEKQTRQQAVYHKHPAKQLDKRNACKETKHSKNSSIDPKKTMGNINTTASFDSSQELRALAFANVVSGFFGGMTVGGSFSGSAILLDLNAVTMLHNFVNAAIMLILIFFMLPLLDSLPKATLSVIIIIALVKLLNFGTPHRLLMIKAGDCFLWVITFICTICFGVFLGLSVGIAAALVVLTLRNNSISIAELGKIPNTTLYRELKRFPDAKRLVQSIPSEGSLVDTDTCLGIYLITGPLNFANADECENTLMTALTSLIANNTKSLKKVNHSQQAALELGIVRNKKVQEKYSGNFKDEKQIEKSKVDSYNINIGTDNTPLTRAFDDSNDSFHMLLSFSGVTHLDSAAIVMLQKFYLYCTARRVKLYFCGWNASCREILYRARAYDANYLHKIVQTEKHKHEEHGFMNNQSVMKEWQNCSGPLNPNLWYLSLHDAVCRIGARVAKNDSQSETDAGSLHGLVHNPSPVLSRILQVRIRDTSVNKLVGVTPKEINFRRQYNASILSIIRSNIVLRGTIGRTIFEPHDVLLINIGAGFSWDNIATKRDLELIIFNDFQQNNQFGTPAHDSRSVFQKLKKYSVQRSNEKRIGKDLQIVKETTMNTMTSNTSKKEICSETSQYCQNATTNDVYVGSNENLIQQEVVRPKDLLAAMRVRSYSEMKDPKYIPASSRSLQGQTVENAGLRGLPGLFLVARQRGRDGVVEHAIGPETLLDRHDVLWFAGHRSAAISTLKAMPGLEAPDITEVKDNKLHTREVTNKGNVVVWDIGMDKTETY